MKEVFVRRDDGALIEVARLDLTFAQIQEGILTAFADDIPKPGRPGEPVIVKDVNRAELAKFADKQANQEIAAGFIANSARHLSGLLGYTGNDAGSALARAKKADETDVTLRGVTFRYLRDDPD